MGLLVLVIVVLWLAANLIRNTRIREAVRIGLGGACLTYFIITKAPAWLIILSVVIIIIGLFFVLRPEKKQDESQDWNRKESA